MSEKHGVREGSVGVLTVEILRSFSLLSVLRISLEENIVCDVFPTYLNPKFIVSPFNLRVSTL